MGIMKEIAKLLGVELLEEFTLKVSEHGKSIGCEINEEITYRIDLELVHKGYNDGYSEWYGWNEKVFYKLCIGLYEVVKIEKENENDE